MVNTNTDRPPCNGLLNLETSLKAEQEIRKKDQELLRMAIEEMKAGKDAIDSATRRVVATETSLQDVERRLNHTDEALALIPAIAIDLKSVRELLNVMNNVSGFYQTLKLIAKFLAVLAPVFAIIAWGDHIFSSLLEAIRNSKH